MCFATCETFMSERNICKRVWLSEILCILGMNPIWKNSYFFEQCSPKRVVYERTRISWNLPNVYSFVSRWLSNTLCYNVCAISSESVSAVAVSFFYTNENSVLQCMWHLLRSFLQQNSIQYCPESSDNHSWPQSFDVALKGIRMALLACCMFSMSISSQCISCTWAVFTSSIAFEQTFGMVSSGESVAESVERARCHGDSLEIICGESSSYNSPVRCTLYYNVISFEHSCDVSHRMQANNISENQQCALRNLCTWAKHIQKHMLSKHFDGLVNDLIVRLSFSY